jgi:CubicO group peptidase (beta-lactamase class C family)
MIRLLITYPEFRLYNPYVTQEFTIRDLLTHRSGMGLGAGDLMLWPGGTDFTVNDIIGNLRYLKPVSGFRTKYDYDNLLYVVAGEVISRVSETSWEEFIEKRIMEPLGMNKSAATYNRLKDKSNVIDAHAPVNGSVQVVDRSTGEAHDAAGGIYSNISDMCRWVTMQLNHGKYGEGLKNQLFSEKVQKEMWSPNTIIPVADSSDYNTHFRSYGLGWGLSDTRGYKQVMHTGGLAGMVTQVTLIPELKLAIMVFTNQQSGAAFRSVTNTILDSYFGMKGMDRIRLYSLAEQKAITRAEKITADIWKDINTQNAADSPKPDNTIYSGIFSDIWFGEVSISEKNGKLFFESKRSPALTGEMYPYKGNTFVVKWNDRSLDADAFVMFNLDKTGKARELTMEAISPLTDFSFDFQDLDFKRVEK